ncbi:MAG: pyridoxal phosphate-dependent aminotransferase [Candidatus Cloacimonetes bacterium]|nr:pyridoxal phosphate-dependent aminotransferase [Candidatus Cloacimonadota bacterium]
MTYDFDSIICRKGSGCFKHDGMKSVYGREGLLPLWVADMEFAVAPQIIEAMQKRLDHHVFGYNFRFPEYYEAVADWAASQYGYRPELDWILDSPGVMPAVSLAVSVFTEPGDGILIQTPVYEPFFKAARDQARTLLTNPLNLVDGRYEIDFEDFEAKLKQARVFILCSPHNPVGRLWSPEELRKMGTLCKQHGVLVISDEIHADLVYNGAKALSIASLEDFADFTICCFSTAKSFNLAGLSTAAVIVKNPRLRVKLQVALRNLHLFMGNSFGISAVIAAYREAQDWLEAALEYLDENRRFLQDAFASELPQLKFIHPEATYLAWVDFRELGLDDAQVRDFLIEKTGIAMVPGTNFGTDGSGFQRLNFACPRSILEEAVQRLKTGLREL